MVSTSRSTAVLAAPLVILAAVCGSASAETTLPVQTPDLPGSPSVGLTPGDGGVGLDLGVGDTNVHVGAGSSGVGVGVGARGSKQPPRSEPVDSVPVRIPALRPGRQPGAQAAGERGANAIVFGAPQPGVEGRVQGDRASGRSFPARRSDARASIVKSAPKERRSSLPPFLEIVERIPAAMRAGLVALALVALALWAAWVRDRRRLAANAFVDPVTGIANAAAFTRLLDRELDRARRYKRPLGLLLLDVSESDREDGKLLHLRDTTVREASGIISGRIRVGETVARLGDNRFAIISPEATEASTETLARALEKRLEERRIHVAVGVAERAATDRGADDLVARAEAAIPAGEPERHELVAPTVLRAA
jgi:diguanylate cyclase (GGDEF)-like protein